MSGEGAPLVKMDVIVVGSGLAGLVTARRLQERGFVVAILEAKSVVGGRIRCGADDAGARYDVGAQWLHPEHTRTSALLEEIGHPPQPFSVQGDVTLAVADRCVRIPRFLSLRGAWPHEITDLRLALWQLQRLVENVYLPAPWHSVDAHQLDGMSFGEWLTRHTRLRWSRDFLRATFEAALGADLHEVSAFHVVFLMASSGSVASFLAAMRGSERLVVEGGLYQLVETLAWSMRERVLLDEKVVVIENSAHDVGLRTERSRYRAKRVVIALPPASWRQIVFDPSLPEDWDVLAEGSVEAASWRCCIRYTTPFWRAEGRSGEALSSGGILRFVTDATPVHGSEGVLLAVTSGAEARALQAMAPEARRQAVLDALCVLLGPSAAHAIDLVEQDWTGNEGSNGGLASLLSAHAWRRHGEAMRARWGRLHFAGAEMATHWAGFIEGAVRSGEEVAEQIAAIEKGSA